MLKKIYTEDRSLPPKMERRDSVLIHPPVPPIPTTTIPSTTTGAPTIPPINIIEGTPTEEFSKYPSSHLSRIPTTSTSGPNPPGQLDPLTSFPSFTNFPSTTTNPSSQKLNITRTNTTPMNNNPNANYRMPSSAAYLPNHLTYSVTNQSDASSTYSHSLQTNTSRLNPDATFKRTSSTNVLDYYNSNSNSYNNNNSSSTTPAPVRFNDQFSSVRPMSQKQDYQQADLLWSQIDILDDVKRFAEESKIAFLKSLKSEEEEEEEEEKEKEEQERRRRINNDEDDQVNYYDEIEQRKDPRVQYLRSTRELREAQVSLIHEIKKNAELLNTDLKQFQQTDQWMHGTQNVESDLPANPTHNEKSEAEQRKRIKKLALARQQFIKGEVSQGLKVVESKLEQVGIDLRKVWEARRTED